MKQKTVNTACTWKSNIYGIFLGLLFLLCYQPALALIWKVSPSSLQKARLKLQNFAQQQDPSFLIVDGNNVRGCCGWSPWQCMVRVEGLRDAYGIHRAVVVWDHGPAKIIVKHSSNTLCLFAGPSQRADDLMIQEGRALKDNYYGETMPNFHNFCFVTNDSGLQQRLRKLGSDPLARVQNTNGPMIFDSTRFMEMTKEMTIDRQQTARIVEAEQLLEDFSKINRIHSKREPTWKRCALVHALLQDYQLIDIDRSSMDDPFGSYWEHARKRGFQTLDQLGVANCVPKSSRLDQKQKQLLDKFNHFVTQQSTRNQIALK